jgi:NitT/TauT family transport system permease protein
MRASQRRASEPADRAPAALGPPPSPDSGARSTQPTRAHRSGRFRLPILLAVLLPVPIFMSTSGLGGFVLNLPQAALFLSYSFLRMLLAYGLSVGFSLAYGYVAATHRPGERIMIPVLDILQSVPILGFFPVAIIFFVSLTGPGSIIGPNLASIFLIFTSMAWNMAFGVYESLKTLPVEMREAADTFGVRGALRLRRVLLPATVNRLVYNSVLSWTAGWFYLVAAEIFSTSASTPTALPGIGSFLLEASFSNNGNALAAGLVLLVALIAVLDVFVWRPAGRWAEKYRYDTTPSGEGEIVAPRRTGLPFRRAVGYVARGVRTGVTRVSSPLVMLRTVTLGPRKVTERPGLRVAARYVAIGTLLVIVWLLLIYIIVGLFTVFTEPIPAGVRAQIDLLPLALLESLGRVWAAYAISLAVAMPLAIVLVTRPRVARLGLPVVEIVASVPATALFPLLIVVLLPRVGAQGAAILMVVTGMIWYLFFNLLSGLRSIPPDLGEAANSFGLRRTQRYRRLVLPGIFGAFVTGSITAFGGGWNSLIIAEYLQNPKGHSTLLSVLGLGQLLDIGNAEPIGGALLASALLTLVITVVGFNELLWKPLYRRAVEKYRYE